jgi:hypothetical protein
MPRRNEWIFRVYEIDDAVTMPKLGGDTCLTIAYNVIFVLSRSAVGIFVESKYIIK